MIEVITSLFNTYINLGARKNISKNELKKIKILNTACLIWLIFLTASSIQDYLVGRFSFLYFCCILLSLFSVLALQYTKKFMLASILFIINMIVLVFIYANFISEAQGKFLELFLIFPPCLSLILLNHKKINLSILFISFCTFFIPNLFFKNYEIHVFNNINFIIFFFSVYVLVSYFKLLNSKNEESLEKKTNQLEELDQFKSQFFTNISHEIRTPLTLINGYVSELDIKNSENQNQRNKITNQINNITNIVDSVLDLAKMQSSTFNVNLQPANISDIIKKTEINFEPLFNQKKLELHVIKQSDDFFSLIDILFFEKAINNLIVNALKYTETGSVTIKLFKKEQQLILKVIDTGIGIAEENKKNVFKRFYQIQNNINTTGGSGIGLAFCKEIIELHNGTITLESELHKGSEFTITLPLITNEISSLKQEEVNNIEENLKNISIEKSNFTFLIVDDNHDMREYLTTILTPNSCIEASNGEEALEIINTNKIDFIITDYMMPKKNGYELITHLNNMNNQTPIIMLTAKTDINVKLDVLKHGVNDYITKPFHKNELLVRINNCIQNNEAKEIYNHQNKTDTTENNQDDFINKLEKFILENSENTTLNQENIILEFNLSKSSFYRKIKSKTGLSPNNFIKEIRLQKARQILQTNTDISLKELTFKVGFSHTSYFSKIYEERFGIKPLQEKKLTY